MGYYFPKIVHYQNRFSVGARLPEKIHRRWIAHIIGNPRLRKTIEQEIEETFASHVFNKQSFLKICWSPAGASFKTDGNACDVGVSEGIYCEHNVDDYEQASVLYIALLKYLARIYICLADFENNNYNPEDFPPLEETFTHTIKLNTRPGCQMTFEECIHKLTWICNLCTRNPKSLRVESKKALKKIGDKWEPPGGLPGKKLCIICGANINALSGKCPYCDEE